ncbi:MAG: glycosyltransferase family 39 protein [Pirellulales bacterium]|nr:glycosyltransferase family 39 protein [Pirellulales bacterium]
MENAKSHVRRQRAVVGLSGLLLLTLVVRAGVLLVVPGALVGDPDGYQALARNVVEYGTFGEGARPTAYRPPLYPLLLTPCVALGEGTIGTWAMGVLHAGLGLATVALVWWLARRCGLGRWAWLAGALAACDPILLGQSTVVMTETAAALLVALALAALIRAVESPSSSRAATAGAVLGLCGLCRPELLLWAALCVPAMLLAWGASIRLPGSKKPERSKPSLPAKPAMAHAAWLIGGVLLVLAPWVARNQIQFGRPIATTTHGGYTLLLANNPSFFEYLRDGKPGTIWDARQLGPDWGGKAHFDSPDAEWAADRQAYAEAWANIRRQPAAFARACLARAGRFWALTPHRASPAVRWAIGAAYLVEFMLAAAGLWAVCFFYHGGTEDTGKKEKNASPCPLCLRGEFPRTTSVLWLAGLLLAVAMTGVHAVYWSDMRMRGPLAPVIALAAAAGMGWLASPEGRDATCCQIRR